MAKSILKKGTAVPEADAPTKSLKSRKRAADMFDEPPEPKETDKTTKKVKIASGKAKVVVAAVPEEPEQKKRNKKSKSSKDEELPAEATPKAKKESKASKKAKNTATTTETTTEESKPSKSSSKSSKKTKRTSKSKDAEVLPEDEAIEATSNGITENGVEGDSDLEDEAVEDQETALLAGFSDSEEDDVPDVGFEAGKELPKVKQTKALSKKLAKANQGADDEPGVIYVGRIPHGFYEHEMRSYFSQFGEVKHVRLSRSRKTGNSKHYAFLQFASSEVAIIVAETMNNYLLFGHILKCHVVPKEQVHENLWLGADKRFKKIPWNKIEARQLALPKGRSEWDKKVKKTQKSRENKLKKLKEAGYDFELPELKDVDSIPVKEVETTVVAVTEDNGTAVTNIEVKKKPKRSKSHTEVDETKPLATEVEVSAATGTGIDEPTSETPKPKKKARKSR